MKPFAALIGDPIKHSRSPQIMGQLGVLSGRDFEYRLIQTQPTDLSETLERLQADPDCVGVNITVPHKEAVLSFVPSRDPSVESVGAANCLVRGKQGAWHAHNTDIVGFQTQLALAEVSVRGRELLVLGAGGAARAVVHALIQLGASQINLWNRSRDRAQRLRTRFGQRVSVVEDLGRLDDLAMVVNTTSLGLCVGDKERLEAQIGPGLRSLLKAQGQVLAMDLVYSLDSLEKTVFLDWISDLGAASLCDGKNMLVAQAVEGFNKWFQSGLDVAETTRDFRF